MEKSARWHWIESLKRPQFRVQKNRSGVALSYCAKAIIDEYGTEAHTMIRKHLRSTMGVLERDFWEETDARILHLQLVA